jgi:hypothetical protein
VAANAIAAAAVPANDIAAVAAANAPADAAVIQALPVEGGIIHCQATGLAMAAAAIKE